MGSVGGVKEFNGHANMFCAALDASFKEVGHAQRSSNLPNVLVFAFEPEGRSPSYDSQRTDLGQNVDDVVCQAVAQVIIARILIQIGERKNGNGGLARAASLSLPRFHLPNVVAIL